MRPQARSNCIANRGTRLAAGAAMLAFSLVAIEPVDMAPAKAGAPLCFGEHADIIGTRAADHLVGTAETDVIVGLKGDDRINGAGGRDRICAGSSNDHVNGGRRGDLVRGGAGEDQLLGGAGSDHLDGGPDRDRIAGGHGQEDADTVVGGSGHDSLKGGDGRFRDDALFGGTGDDYLDGGDGKLVQSTLFGGPGNDYLFGAEGGYDIVSFRFSPSPVAVDLGPKDVSLPNAIGEGDDYLEDIESVEGSFGDDTIVGTDEPNRLHGLLGSDTISGGASDDRLDGGRGSDLLDAGAGMDLVSFQSAASGVEASLQDEAAATEDSSDTLIGFENLEGSYYDDVLTGDDMRNSIFGSYGNNTIFARAGDDYIEFGDEGDAGAGIDECIWASAVENCERYGHFDPRPMPHVTSPKQGSTLLSSEFTRIRGGIAGGLGPSPRRVYVALRLPTSRGCLWWSKTEHELLPRPCKKPLWNAVDIADRNLWRLPISATLPPGLYDVWTSRLRRGPRSPWISFCHGAFGPPCVSFRLEN